MNLTKHVFLLLQIIIYKNKTQFYPGICDKSVIATEKQNRNFSSLVAVLKNIVFDGHLEQKRETGLKMTVL
jgi:hypothetical protein